MASILNKQNIGLYIYLHVVCILAYIRCTSHTVGTGRFVQLDLTISTWAIFRASQQALARFVISATAVRIAGIRHYPTFFPQTGKLTSSGIIYILGLPRAFHVLPRSDRKTAHASFVSVAIVTRDEILRRQNDLDGVVRLNGKSIRKRFYVKI